MRWSLFEPVIVEAYSDLDLTKEYSISKLSDVHILLSNFIACREGLGEEEAEEEE
jgi:hypothetical protein